MPKALRSLRCALAVAVAAAAGAAASADGASGPELERAVVAAVNRHREGRGLAPLAWSDAAAELARAHSREMAAGRTGFGHDGFDARRQALRKDGASAVAENVWTGTAAGDLSEEALARWLASAGHRRNIEGAYQQTGVGAAVTGDGSVYLTQIFFASSRQSVPEASGG